MELEFLDRFSKNTQTSNFTKIPSVEVELFHADGQTTMTTLTVAFPYFAKALKNEDTKYPMIRVLLQ
jgi:hypothetical protein